MKAVHKIQMVETVSGIQMATSDDWTQITKQIAEIVWTQSLVFEWLLQQLNTIFTNWLQKLYKTKSGIQMVTKK